MVASVRIYEESLLVRAAIFSIMIQLSYKGGAYNHLHSPNVHLLYFNVQGNSHNQSPYKVSLVLSLTVCDFLSPSF